MTDRDTNPQANESSDGEREPRRDQRDSHGGEQPSQQGQPRQGQPRQGQPPRGTPQQSQPRQGQPQQSQPRQGQPQQGQPRQGQRQGQPQQGQRQGQPQQGQRQGQPQGQHRRQQPSRESGSFFADISWKRSLLFGFGAFIVGFIIIFGFFMIEGVTNEDEFATNNPDGVLTVQERSQPEVDAGSAVSVIGWLFHSTHFVDIEGSSSVDSASIDFISLIDDEVGLTIPAPIWRLVPAVVLTGLGYLLARSPSYNSSPSSSAKRGASIVAGYLPIVLLSTVLFTESINDATLEPNFAQALLLAGLVYPLVFGALGGYLAHRTGSTPARR